MKPSLVVLSRLSREMNHFARSEATATDCARTRRGCSVGACGGKSDRYTISLP